MTPPPLWVTTRRKNLTATHCGCRTYLVSESPTIRVARKIRGVMAERGKTQAHLAAVLGMSQQSVSRRLTGGQPFSVAELIEVAAFLEVEPASLLPSLAAAS